MSPERWGTDEELAEARQRFADRIPGYVAPEAYSVARIDDGALTFGHVNDVGDLHRLPAAVLASVCGYVADTGTFELRREQLSEAVQLLSPAEAAEHWDHPNLWSWRDLLNHAAPESRFVAVFVRDVADAPADRYDTQFRTLLRSEPPPS